MSFIYKPLFEFFKKIRLKTKYTIREYQQNKFNGKLIKIRKRIQKINSGKQVQAKKKILFGMSFSVFEPNRVHDFLLSQALSLRGAEIIPVICGGVQNWQCCVSGGVWGGYTGDINRDEKANKKNCTSCLQSDLKIWKEWGGLEPIFLDKYISEKIKNEARAIVESYDFSEYKNWMYEGINIGSLILNVMRNNEMLHDEKLIFNYKEIIKNYFYNIIILMKGLKKALEEIKPDTVISNNTFYYPWAVLEVLCLRRGIPIYSSGPGGRKDSWCYALNQRAIPVDKNISDLWNFWKNNKLSLEQDSMVSRYLQEMSSGKHMALNTARFNTSKKDFEKKGLLFDFSKPTALLAANVIWDAAALGVDNIFTNMFEWINKTIDFFADNPEWQLIIKAHPTEEHKLVPVTRQKIFDEIMSARKALPSNVVFVGPKSEHTLYDFLPYVNLGLTYSSTVGIEFACHGIPIVTAAKAPYIRKGFTYDPENQEKYFDMITFLFCNQLSKQKIDEIVVLSRKFLYLYHFMCYLDVDFFKWDCYGNIIVNISRAKDLAAGRNVFLDYLCDSILNNLPIYSQNRQPPIMVNKNY